MAACIRGPRTLANSSDLNHKNSASNYKAFIKTYSKWVNHYLEKARSKKLIQDLQADLTDGVLLADVIEAVTSHKVPNINRKPKTATQMCENIQACLCFLEQIGIALDGINVREVREGNLKAILGLIFGLSVHKQRQKQQQQQQQQPQQPQQVTVERDRVQRLTTGSQESGLTKLPSPFYSNTNDSSSSSGIPTPATGARLSAIERYNGLNTAITPLKSASTNSSRSTSPSHSFIPAPRVSARSSLNEKQLTGSGVPRSSNVPTRVSLASPYNPANAKTSILFTPKDKPKSSLGSAKRTSSSSGFSSARSERSDSSNSLYNDPKQATLEKKIPTTTESGLRKKVIKTGESKIATKTTTKVQQSRPLSKAALDKQNELTNSMTSDTNDESRLSIGGGSSIPKPLAAVKGTSKPTHCVSPMPVLEQTTIVIENANNVKKKEDDDEKKAKEESSETEKILPPVVNSHSKQVSLDEEDCMSSIKPMLPFRGYPKQNGMAQRTHLSSEQLAMHHQSMAVQSQPYMRHMENSRTMLNSDHSAMNGYLSDGEILQNGSSSRSVSDYCDGYMSEGTAIYSNPPNNQRPSVYSQPGKESKLQPVQRIIVKPKPKKLNDEQSKVAESKSPCSTLNAKENHVKVLVGEHQVITSMDYRGTNGGEPPPAIIYRSGRSHVKKSDSSQQTETSAFPSKQWNSDSSRTPEKRIISQRKLDKKSSDSHSREELGCIEYCNGDRKLNLRDSKTKVRGVPPSFGYTKRPTNGDGSKGGETRTAQVSAVPRTKVKVSGGTQTETINNSQNVRDRISTFPRTSYSSHVSGDLSEAESLPASQSHHRVSLARLSRSNSIRSTKSEKVYPSMLQRSEELDPYYNIPYNIHHSSQPTSPTPSQMSQGTLSRMYYQMWPGGGGSMWSARNMGLLAKVGSKDDDVHGSAVSLYSAPEEKQALEVRKLRRQLADAHDKVHTLTTQLSTNAHVVSAFEQSLSNMTQRLHQLTATTEKKDSELHELRQTIERINKQTNDTGLNSVNMSPSLARRHTINTTAGSTISRQLSTDSVSSLNSLSSANSTQQSDSEKKKKRGWLRSSFSKAFTKPKKNRSGSASDAEANDTSVPSSPLLNTPHLMNGDLSQQNVKLSHSSSALCDRNTQDIVDELRRQLREKDLVLTDIRLEALSSAHQLESLKDTVINMRNEMLNLKQDNERLQRIVATKSLASSQSSLPLSDLTDAPLADNLMDPILCENEGKKISVTVYLGAHGSYNKYVEEGCDISIGFITVGSKTKWDTLDSSVKRCFKDYLEKLDPGSCLGLAVDSVWSYHVGEITRYKESPVPDLLPCGYLVGDTTSIPLCLKGSLHNSAIDALAFQTLIPKPIIQRYVTLLTEHRRIILCGPSGTGKSYLASKLADFLVLRLGKDSSTGAVATVNVEHKSNKELKQWLCNIAETCETEMLPSVIVLDNLHHAADSLSELFNGFTTAKYPYIIGTISQATTSTTDLQLHHNFRWILCVNHMEPVKGLLGRILRRKLVDIETRSERRNTELARVVEWLPRVWHHLNQFLETHCSSDVTIGPRVFVGCPLESGSAQAWFTDVWNYSVIPYLQDMVREGLQLYGKRAPWHDPASFVVHTYPWPGDPSNLQRLAPEDVGFDAQNGTSSKTADSDADADPLLNMLMRLQEAANYSSPLSNDSDTNTHSGIESTL